MKRKKQVARVRPVFWSISKNFTKKTRCKRVLFNVKPTFRMSTGMCYKVGQHENSTEDSENKNHLWW